MSVKERLLELDICCKLGAIRARTNVGEQEGVSISRNSTSHDTKQDCSFFFFWQEVIEVHIECHASLMQELAEVGSSVVPRGIISLVGNPHLISVQLGPRTFHGPDFLALAKLAHWMEIVEH